jgi:hypothetical protein
MTVRYLLTRDFMPRFYFVQENVVNHNLGTLREKYASFPAINLRNRVTYLVTQTCLSKIKFSNQIQRFHCRNIYTSYCKRDNIVQVRLFSVISQQQCHNEVSFSKREPMIKA